MSDVLLASALRQHQAGNLAEAARLYATVLRANPRNFQALYLLGFVHSQQGLFEEAARLIGEAVRINPNSPDAFYNYGCALQNLQRHSQALEAFVRAIALKPDYADAMVNRGVALLALKRHAEAVASFDRALTFNPRDAEALSNRSTALFEMKRYDEAGVGFAQLMTVAPDFPSAAGNLVLTKAYRCDWSSFAEDRARIASAIRAGKTAIPPHGGTLILDDPHDQLLCARRWVVDRYPPARAPLWRGDIYRHDRIRLAYVSADFHSHATAILIAGVFEHHDRAGFETILVSFGPDDKSDMRARLIDGCDRFLDVVGKTDVEIATGLRKLEIDIAVDLKGFTDGCRPGIFAHRPAPIQVNYLAHPGTMGAPYIDYLIADEAVIPPDQQRHYSEKIVYLPDSYQANDDKRRIATDTPGRAETGLPETGFVFCSFNSSFKITPPVFDIWMRLLRNVEGSVLWLLDDNPAAVANLKREAEVRGVPAPRLIFAPRVNADAHLARHRLADFFLDTLPCGAHTTASDALWAGLPVLTVAGPTFAGRVAASLNRAIGMDALTAPSLEAYEALALAMARDPARLAQFKQRLAQNRRTQPLFDTARFTRDLERAFSGMCERYRRGEQPSSFAVLSQE